MWGTIYEHHPLFRNPVQAVDRASTLSAVLGILMGELVCAVPKPRVFCSRHPRRDLGFCRWAQSYGYLGIEINWQWSVVRVVSSR